MGYNNFVRKWWEKSTDEDLELHRKAYQQTLEESEDGIDIGASTVNDCFLNLIYIGKEKKAREGR